MYILPQRPCKEKEGKCFDILASDISGQLLIHDLTIPDGISLSDARKGTLGIKIKNLCRHLG